MKMPNMYLAILKFVSDGQMEDWRLPPKSGDSSGPPADGGGFSTMPESIHVGIDQKQNFEIIINVV